MHQMFQRILYKNIKQSTANISVNKSPIVNIMENCMILSFKTMFNVSLLQGIVFSICMFEWHFSHLHMYRRPKKINIDLITL